jgi:hypothetical protein
MKIGQLESKSLNVSQYHNQMSEKLQSSRPGNSEIRTIEPKICSQFGQMDPSISSHLGKLNYMKPTPAVYNDMVCDKY